MISGRRTVALAGIVALVAAVALAIAGAHVRPNRFGNDSLHVEPYSGRTAAQTGSPSGSVPPQRKAKPSLATDLTGAFLFLLGSLAVLAAIVVLAMIARAVVRRRSITLRRRRPPLDAGSEAAPDVPTAIRQAVAGALEELSVERPATDSIIQCWQRLVAAAAGAGQAAAESDTPEETITRLQRAGLTRIEPLRRLADLYREARFSRHTMTADDVAAARGALTYILGDLAPDGDAGSAEAAHAPT